MNGNGSKGVFQSHKLRNTGQLNSETKHWKAAAPTWNYKGTGAWNNAHESMSFPQNWWGKEQATAAKSSFLASYSLEEEEILLLMFTNANKFLNQIPVDCSEIRDAFGEGNYTLKQVL